MNQDSFKSQQETEPSISDADDFEPKAAADRGATDKWDGEDEDDDVKDAWDAESGEENGDR